MAWLGSISSMDASESEDLTHVQDGASGQMISWHQKSPSKMVIQGKPAKVILLQVAISGIISGSILGYEYCNHGVWESRCMQMYASGIGSLLLNTEVGLVTVVDFTAVLGLFVLGINLFQRFWGWWYVVVGSDWKVMVRWNQWSCCSIRPEPPLAVLVSMESCS